MKKAVFLFLGVFISLIFFSCNSFDKIKYNDELVKYCTKQNKLYAEFGKALYDTTIGIEELDQQFNDILSQMQQNYDDFKKNVKPRENIFYPAADSFMKGVIEIMNNQGKSLVNLIKTGQISQISDDSISNLVNSADNRIKLLFKAVIEAQTRFADKYHVELEDE